MRRLLIAAALVLLATGRSPAQGVPRFSIELTKGSGDHTVHTSKTEYDDSRVGLDRLAATLRIGRPGSIRPVVTVEGSGSCLFACNELLYGGCRALASRSGCAVPFDSPSGFATSIGLRGVWDLVLGGVSVGVARYQHAALYASADVSMLVMPHAGIIADVRHILSTDAMGNRTWFSPLSFGLRVY